MSPESAAAVAAAPYPFEFDPAVTALVIIDMQRDFVLPGGFGERLGNDTSLLLAAVEPTRRVLNRARETTNPIAVIAAEKTRTAVRGTVTAPRSAIADAPSSARVGERASQSTCGVSITAPAPARR